jgi:hypothetical protein
MWTKSPTVPLTMSATIPALIALTPRLFNAVAGQAIRAL